MNISEFIKKYDVEGAVVLLEGKRNVLPEEQEKLTLVAQKLAEKTKSMRFRSGNAGGSDELFAKGIANVNPSRMEVVIPYTGHRKRPTKIMLPTL
jgi:hypothetical protein